MQAHGGAAGEVARGVSDETEGAIPPETPAPSVRFAATSPAAASPRMGGEGLSAKTGTRPIVRMAEHDFARPENSRTAL